MPTLEIFMMASPSGRCSSVNCAMVNWGNRGSLPTADVDELCPANHPKPADTIATIVPPTLRIFVIERLPLCRFQSSCSRAGTFGPKTHPQPPNVPRREHFLNFRAVTMKYSRPDARRSMERDENSIDQRASGTASAFGSMIRDRRKALKMRQDQLALATGVGRRFLIELEAGKPSCQLGRSLLVAQALGLTAADILAHRDPSAAAPDADLPELPDALPELPEELPEALPDVEEPDGRPAGVF